tara:strand:+ start:3754 stop:5049 length:1296 start_codon:yes stop_codon:yes gene_type:complete
MENGKMAVARGLKNGVGCGTTEFHVLRPWSQISPEFLRHYVQRTAFRRFAKRYMAGAVGQQRVPPEILRQSYIPLPPSAEQTRIADAIDAAFAKIEAGEKSIAEARRHAARYRKAVLKAAVTGELTKDWREERAGELEAGEVVLARLLKERRAAWESDQIAKAEAKGKPLKGDAWKTKYKPPVEPDTDDLPELPKGWVWASLDQASWASQYGTSAKCGYDEAGEAVLRIPNVRERKIIVEDIKRAKSAICLGARDYLQNCDLLIIRTNGSPEILGLGAVVLRIFSEPTYFASYLIRFRLSGPRTLWEWVNTIWPSSSIREFIRINASTSAGQYNISQSNLAHAPLPLPSPAEQAEIVSRVEAALDGADRLDKQLDAQQRAARALRQAILKSAFEGRLVAQDPDDEPAETLLERIRAERAAASAKPRTRKRA